MLKAKELKELLKDIPDDANITAYEGEQRGLIIEFEGKLGWIETSGEHVPADSSRHEKLQ